MYTYSTYNWHSCIYISRFGDFVSTTTITATTTELTFLHAHGVVNAKLVNACTCLYLSLTNSQVCFLPWDFFVCTKFTGCNWHMPSCAYFRSNIIHILRGGNPETYPNGDNRQSCACIEIHYILSTEWLMLWHSVCRWYWPLHISKGTIKYSVIASGHCI